MADDLNTVKTPAPAVGAPSGKGDGYHHGALREALVAAAEEVIRERGVDGFSLREAARRAGVSAAAPQHHFGDARGLLTVVATAGFVGLGDALAAADAGAADRAARIRRQGEAYVGFALAQPARFDVMWRKARIDGTDAAYAAAAGRALELLEAAVADRPVRNAPNGASKAAPEAADPRALACWALVHGFARLALDGAFGPGPEAAQAAADALLPRVLDCLAV